MSFEVESQINGELVKNSVKISNRSMQNELFLKGYGEKYEKDFILNSIESLYLSYIKKLKVSRAKKNISFDDLLSNYKKIDNDIFKKLRVALKLRDDDIVQICALVDFKVTKSELGAIFRKEDHPKYVECGDQFLRNFLNGLVIHLRGPMPDKREKKAT